jgi:hypothetical protein
MLIHSYSITLLNYKTRYVAAFTYSKIDVDAVKKWCYETFGPPTQRYDEDMRWWDGIKYGEVEFVNEEDLLMFILRWAG